MLLLNNYYNFVYFIFSQNYEPPKNYDLARHIGTKDLSRPLSPERTSDLVAHKVSLISSCFKPETKNTKIQPSNNEDTIIGVNILFCKNVNSVLL